MPFLKHTHTRGYTYAIDPLMKRAEMEPEPEY